MYEDLLNDPLFQAGAIGFARGVVGYIEAYLNSKTPFDLSNFVGGFLRTGLMAYGFGVAAGTPAAAFALPLDMGYSAIKASKK